MTTIHLDVMFRPRSLAVIGATDRAGSVGRAVVRNSLAAGFGGPVLPVNPRRGSVAGVLAYPDVESLPLTPELAVVCTPAPTVPAIVEALGARGTRGVVVLSAGFGAPADESGTPLGAALLRAARRHGVRVLGPNCVGLIVPGAGLDASFATGRAAAGGIAFVAQSDELCTAMLD